MSNMRRRPSHFKSMFTKDPLTFQRNTRTAKINERKDEPLPFMSACPKTGTMTRANGCIVTVYRRRIVANMATQYRIICSYNVAFQSNGYLQSLVGENGAISDQLVVRKPTPLTCIACASSRLSSSVFIVTNLRTNKFNDAATIAKPNRININANITYSGFLFSALSFCKATMSPNPAERTRARREIQIELSFGDRKRLLLLLWDSLLTYSR